MAISLRGNSKSTFTDEIASAKNLGTGGTQGEGQLVGYQQGEMTIIIPNGGGTTIASNTAWTRIGNRVEVTIDFTWGTVPTGPDELRIGGLPYTCALWASGSMYVQNKDTECIFVPYPIKDQDYIAIQMVPTTAALGTTTNATCSAAKTGFVNIHISYITKDTTWTPINGATIS